MKSKLPKALRKEKKDIYNKRFGVIFNGEDNLKPLITENIIENSPTASQCAWTYQSFLGGGGFAVGLDDVNLSDNFWEYYTPNDLLDDVSRYCSIHQGTYILVGYNANYQKDHYKIIPNDLCCVGKKDSDGYSGKIVVSPKGWERNLKKEDVDVYDTYNPRPEVIAAQVERDGGWDNYKGQILYFKFDNRYTYSTPLIDRAIPFAITEYKMGLFYEGTVSRSFEDITFIRHRQFPDKKDEQDFYKNIEELSGVENANSKLIIQDEWDDEREKSGNFKFDTIKNDTKPEKYAHFENSSSNFIRKVFKNIPPQLIDYIQGKLGNTSGEDLIKAQSIYNALTAKDRNKLERLFKELFWNYKEDINPTDDWTISQYKLFDDGTASDNEDLQDLGSNKQSQQSDEEKLNKEAQANLRGSVGGVTGVLSIQSSVSEEITDYDSGLTMLEEIFGFSNDIARKILGTPKKGAANGNVNE